MLIFDSVLFEDKDILVINKPAGVVVTKANSVRSTTIQEMVWQFLQQQSEKSIGESFPNGWQTMVPDDFDDRYGVPEAIFAQRQGIVHRLDKDTSGALVLAKHPGSLVALLAQFKNRQVKKKYQCLVHGGFTVPEDTITMPVGRSSSDRKKFAISFSGRRAVTHYKVIRFLHSLDVSKIRKVSSQHLKNLRHKAARIYQGFSLMECRIETGRTHQIRVHLSSIKHPIVGDATYVGRKRKKLDPLWCPRQFLHATQLEFTHPRTDERITITAPLTDDLNQVLSYLK